MSYTTNNLDQYTTLTGANNITYTYDNNGNLASDGTRSYKYDYNNRLIEVNIGTGNLAKYTYDILGRRTQKIDSTNGTSTIFVYAGDNIISEYKTTGSLTLKKNYINGIGTDNIIAYDAEESNNPAQISFCQNRVLPYSSEFTSYGYTAIVNDCNNILSSGTGITTNRYYYHKNQLGSVIALTNSTGLVVQTYSYDAFGKAYVSHSGGLTSLDTYSGSTYSNNRLYTGREYDKEIGMYYLRARYYNADTGRFISRDPVGQNDQINLYTYVKNSPLMYTDRDGRKASQMLADTGDIASRLLYNSLVFLDNNSDKIIFGIGAALTSGGTAIAGFTAPACTASVSVTGGCVILASPTGPGVIACSAPAVTAGAICSTTGIGIGMAGIGTYLMANSGKGGDSNGGKQDKVAGKKELEKIANKEGYSDIHALKKDFGVNDSKIDAFFKKDGELYFKRKPLKGEEYDPVFTNFFK